MVQSVVQKHKFRTVAETKNFGVFDILLLYFSTNKNFVVLNISFISFKKNYLRKRIFCFLKTGCICGCENQVSLPLTEKKIIFKIKTIFIRKNFAQES